MPQRNYRARIMRPPVPEATPGQKSDFPRGHQQHYAKVQQLLAGEYGSRIIRRARTNNTQWRSGSIPGTELADLQPLTSDSASGYHRADSAI